MHRFLRLGKVLLPGLCRRFRPRLATLVTLISILSLMALSYLFGAVTILTELPPTAFLRKAFAGAKAWSEREKARHQSPPWLRNRPRAQTTITLDKPGQTFDGYTLYTTVEGSGAVLMDMHGNEVHRWNLPFDPAWRAMTTDLEPFPANKVHWFRCHPFPNGDLLAIYHADGDTPYGYGLVKMDRDSRLLWVYAGNAHHDLDIAEDGTIYVLTQRLADKPPAGWSWFPAPYIADDLVILSPEGKELEKIPILEAFYSSPYALTFSFLAAPRLDRPPHIGPGLPWPPHPLPPSAPQQDPLPMGAHSTPTPGADTKGDPLHTNSVRVLGRALASKFPLFKPGQVLISLNACSTLAVLDRESRSVVWASQGIWKAQHDAEFLDNGNLLLFDNHGSPRGSRVLEYNPRTQAIPWYYDGEDGSEFLARSRGVKQRLPNGNTFIVDPDGGRLVEVTPDKERVWECLLPIHPGAAITGASRHAPDTLTFLKGKARARP